MTQKLRLLHNLIIVLLGGSILASCFDDTTIEYDTYNDLAITSVVIGNVPRTVFTVNAHSKKDSTYESTLSGSGYPLTIDQVNNRVYNVDSLPYGVHPERIIFSSFTVKDGAIGVVIPGTDRDTVYATADTLDFSKGPRKFNLYGADGVSRRTYEVDVRVHRQKYDSVTWRKLTAAEWEIHRNEGPHVGNEYPVAGITFRLLDGKIEKSADGIRYETDRVADEDLANIPTGNLAWIHATSRAYSHIEEVLLYGTALQNDTLVSKVWRRNIDTTGETDYAWDYFNAGIENQLAAYGLRDAALYPYDKGYLLVGIRNNGTIAIQHSADRGRTWKTHAVLKLPASLKDRQCSSLKSALDKDSNLWLFIDEDEVWYGRAHSVSWNEEQLSFVN